MDLDLLSAKMVPRKKTRRREERTDRVDLLLINLPPFWEGQLPALTSGQSIQDKLSQNRLSKEMHTHQPSRRRIVLTRLRHVDFRWWVIEGSSFSEKLRGAFRDNETRKPPFA